MTRNLRLHQPADDGLWHRQPSAKRSSHARQRQAERAIPDAVVDGLLAFGRPARTPDGKAWRWTFGRRGWARFAAWLGTDARAFERYRRVYVITSSNDVVLTAAWEWH